MRSFLLIGALALGVMLPAYGQQIQPCATLTTDRLTYAVLIGSDPAGGCTIGDKLFSNFGFSASQSGSALLPTAGAFTVGIVNNGDSGIGFDFTYGFSTQANQTQDVALSYTVTVQDPTRVIEDASATLSGSTNLDGFWSLTENLCLTGVSGCASPVPLNIDSPALSNGVVFPGVTVLAVSKNLLVNGGTQPGTLAPGSSAEVTDWTNLVSQESVPEPVTMMLLGSGLALVGLLRRVRPR